MLGSIVNANLDLMAERIQTAWKPMADRVRARRSAHAAAVAAFRDRCCDAPSHPQPTPHTNLLALVIPSWRTLGRLMRDPSWQTNSGIDCHSSNVAYVRHADCCRKNTSSKLHLLVRRHVRLSVLRAHRHAEAVSRETLAPLFFVAHMPTTVLALWLRVQELEQT